MDSITKKVQRIEIMGREENVKLGSGSHQKAHFDGKN